MRQVTAIRVLSALLVVALATVICLGLVLQRKVDELARIREAFRIRCMDHYLALVPEHGLGSAANMFRFPCRTEIGIWNGNPAPPNSPPWW